MIAVREATEAITSEVGNRKVRPQDPPAVDRIGADYVVEGAIEVLVRREASQK